MYRSFVVFVLIASMHVAVIGQGGDDRAAMNQRIIALYQQGKFDDAITLAEQVVAREKKVGKTSEQYAMALTNLGMLHKEKAKQFKKGLTNSELRMRQGPYADATRSADKAKAAFRQALEVYAETKRSESNEAAVVKGELAWLTYNFIHSRTTSETRAQIDEAETLYSESIAHREKLGAGDTDLTLRTILEFGDFYMNYVNFEKALQQYEIYTARVEKRHGDKSKRLVPALRGLKEIYLVTLRESDAKAVADRIAAISGGPETVSRSYPVLTHRSRKIANVKVQGFIPIDFSDNRNNIAPFGLGGGPMVPIRSLKLKALVVDITVDEQGNVTEAHARTRSKFEKEIEAAASESKFRPFSYQGKGEKMRGSIEFRYFER